MSRILFLVFINSFIPVVSQTLQQAETLADSLSRKGLTTEAIELYDRIIFFSPDSIKPYKYLKKVQLLSLAGENKQIHRNLIYAYYLAAGKDSLQKKIILDLAFYSILNGEYIAAINVIEENYLPNWLGVREKSLLLGVAYTLINFKNEAKANFEIAGYPDLGKTIYKCIGNIKRKAWVVNLASAIVPGMGQLLLGQTKSGLNALGLNMAFGAGFYFMAVSFNPVDALILVGAYWSRYYLGNLANTMSMTQSFVANSKKKLLRKFLKKELPANLR